MIDIGRMIGGDLLLRPLIEKLEYYLQRREDELTLRSTPALPRASFSVATSVVSIVVACAGCLGATVVTATVVGVWDGWDAAGC